MGAPQPFVPMGMSLTAGELGRTAIVFVGPPLSCGALVASLGSVLVLEVWAGKRKLWSSEML